jgi:hypothetical protein
MKDQGELFGLLLQQQHPYRLRANDVIRIEGKLCRVVRVNECAAVVLMNRQVREFKTRFDKPVRIQPSPVMFRISANTEAEILNPKARRKHKQRNGKEDT